MYILEYRDWCGNLHTKKYKNIGCAISKFFKIKGWYKNGTLTKDGRQIL